MRCMRKRHEDHACSMLGEGSLRSALAPPNWWLWVSAIGMASQPQEEMIMRLIVGALLGLSLLVGAAASASAADRKVTGWVDSGQGGRPIFTCPNQNS
jgi:hypothetical protein